MHLATSLRKDVLAEQSQNMLNRYLDQKRFSGYWFGITEGRGDREPVANQFTAEDVVELSTLGV